MEERWLKQVLSDAKKAQERPSRGPSSPMSYTHSSSSSSSSSKTRPSGVSSPTSVIPKSVRGAPPEMRLAIRRKQNSESMRRQRAKQRAEEDEMEMLLRENQARMARLEKRVENIETVVERRERRKDQAVKRRAKAKQRK